MKQSNTTSCCIKTPSMSSMGVNETTFSADAEPLSSPSANNNNNNKFYTKNNEKSLYRFSKKLAVDVKFTDIYFRAREWTYNRLPVMKEILHGISGEFRAGELTAIMGPSGAGKTSLLNILAGYKIKGSEGSVMMNGRNRTGKYRSVSCYIMQDDQLRPKLTVMEAMAFAAHCKLGFSTCNKRRNELLEQLDTLGLREHMDTRIGSLSGGQKKRLSIALELISNPPIIFLDEPTTGLDSSSCSQCVSLLKLLAQQGRTVVCTIHQPSALVFEMFDHLYTLAEGCCIYQGTVKALVPYLSGLGFNCPTYHNPADFLMEVASGDYNADLNVLAAEAAKKSGDRRKTSIFTVTDNDVTIRNMNGINGNCNEVSTLHEEHDVPRTTVGASIFTQFFLLYFRNLLIMTRSCKSLSVRIGAHIIIGLVFGYLYQNVGRYADTVFGNYVYLYGTTLFLIYTSKMAVTLSIPMEMTSLRLEYFNRWYSLVPSFLAIILIQIPLQIIASSSYIAISHYFTDQTTDPYRMQIFYLVCIVAGFTAQAFGLLIGVVAPLKIAVFLSPVIAVLLSTVGFNIFYRDIPEYFMWLYHISYFRAAFHSLLLTTYGEDREVLPCNSFYCHYKYPEKFLEEMDIHDRNIGNNMIFVSSYGLVLHICTVVVMWIKLNRR